MSNEVTLVRANKVTTQFEGEGVVVGTFYKTHDKLGQVRTTDAAVITSGFVMPVSTPAEGDKPGVEVTASQKLEAFKNFLQANASQFGYIYDPVDRRPDANRFPSSYSPEVLLETAGKVLVEGITKVGESTQKHIDSLVKAGLLAEGTKLAISVGTGNVNVSEQYKNGNLKYADVTFPVTLAAADKSTVVNVKIDLVSGQLRKPRDFGAQPFTFTGMKTSLLEAGVIPEAPKKEKEEVAADAPAVADAPAENVAK